MQRNTKFITYYCLNCTKLCKLIFGKSLNCCHWRPWDYDLPAQRPWCRCAGTAGQHPSLQIGLSLYTVSKNDTDVAHYTGVRSTKQLLQTCTNMRYFGTP